MNYVKEFEKTIAEFFGSRYAVAVDSCTHAIELCLRLENPSNATCPKHTYVGVPMLFKKLSIPWYWNEYEWEEFYYITPSIVDAATIWRKDSYKFGTLMCISFQYKKHLSVNRGGMILLDNGYKYQELCKMRYDGRVDDIPWAEQDIDTVGYHYYMTPETAQLGLERFEQVKDLPAKKWSYKNYPDVSKMKVFN